MNRFAHILFSTDHDSEYDEDDCRVEVVQSVNPIVIIPAFQPSIGCKTPQYAVKPETIENNVEYVALFISLAVQYKYYCVLSI